MLEEIRQTAQRRLREIEPLIEEAERLRDVLAVIEERTVPARDSRQASASIRRPGSPATRGSTQRAQTGMRAAKGSNKRLILESIGQQPGITPAEIARTTGLKRTVVASTVSRLKRYGELRDHERGGVSLASTDPKAPKQRRRPSSGGPRSVVSGT
jgi:hypothetical protein